MNIQQKAFYTSIVFKWPLLLAGVIPMMAVKNTVTLRSINWYGSEMVDRLRLL